MEKNNRYYWIKLKTDFFNQETIDFLLSQKNGCEYIVLYQMLCLQTANNNGIMATKIGEILIPYDINKIVRDTKYFDIDTVTVALSLFKKLGLIYEENNEILKITNIDDMVGSESSSAKRVREYRERQKALQSNKDVTQEIEYRYKSIDIDINNNKKEKYKKEKNKKEIEEIIEYLNNKLGTKYRKDTKSTIESINARLNNGYNFDDFKKVIDFKYDDWFNKEDMKQYLCPNTLFRESNFDRYLNQANMKNKESEEERLKRLEREIEEENNEK